MLDVLIDGESPGRYVPFEILIGVNSWEAARSYLKNQFLLNDTERKRKADAFERDELYENRGESYMSALVDKAYLDPENRKLRKALISVTKWNNVTARVVGEKATVYSEPARRRADDENYQAFLELMDTDEVLGELDALLALHEDVWVQYRVREVTPGGPRIPSIDLVSPALFWAVSPPRDCTLHIATLLEQKPGDEKPDPFAHHYLLWTPYESISLDSDLRLLGRSLWPLGRMPGFVASTRPATGKRRLLALSPNADVVSAHKAVWFQDILLFKESKSANKQTFFSGDTSAATLGQQADTEADNFVPEGVNITSVDRGMDQNQFRDNADHILERTGANHGLPPTVLHQADASSGAEVYLRRLPLRELRAKRIPKMRRIERQLAEIQSMVNEVDLPEFAFSMDGWGIDFGEVQQPMSQQERNANFEKERQLGLKSTAEEEMDRNPDLKTKDEAKERIRERQEDETQRVADQQDLQRMNGGMGGGPITPTPEHNGALGQAASNKPVTPS